MRSRTRIVSRRTPAAEARAHRESGAIAIVDFTPLQGGVPIVVGGVVVGAIGVSGAASQQRDEAVAQAGAAALE